MIDHKKDPTLKVILLGNSSVGKTCIINRFVYGNYSLSTMPTIAAGVTEKSTSVGEFTPKIQIWDTAGQERFASLSKMFYRNAHACLFVFDLTKPDTLSALNTWRTEFLSTGKYTKEDTPPLFLVGNKNDMKIDSTLITKEIEKWSETYNTPHFEVSASKNQKIEELFEVVCEKALTFHQEQVKKHSENKGEINLLVEDEVKKKRSCCINL